MSDARHVEPVPAEVLQLVRRSPELVADQDKAAWLALFAPEFVVEDPVGSRPVVDRAGGNEMLGHFWDAFIGGNDIVFTVHQDWIDGPDVFRDVVITTTMATGVTVRTPAHLLYQTVGTGDGLRVRRMAAHWEPLPVYAQLARLSIDNLRSGMGMGRRMLTSLGPAGALAFVGAVRSAARPAKSAVVALAAERGVQLDHVIASGDFVTGTGTADSGPVAVLASVDPRSREVTDLRVFDRRA